MTFEISRLAFALALTIAAIAPASAQSGTPDKRVAKPARAAKQAAPAAPIICTKYFCKPLPANCHAETEFTFEGPTGYQIIVCP